MNQDSEIIPSILLNNNLIKNTKVKFYLQSDLYQDMISISTKLLKKECPGHSLQSHDLVHETYLRMSTKLDINLLTRSHFKNTCAKIMFRILVDHARHIHCEKYGGLYQHVAISDVNCGISQHSNNSELFSALHKLHKVNELLFNIVVLRYFAGFNINEIAIQLQRSPATIKRKGLAPDVGYSSSYKITDRFATRQF